MGVLALTWLIPFLPLLSAAVLMLFGRRAGRKASAVLGVGSVAAAAVLSLLVLVALLFSDAHRPLFVQHLWTWLDAAGVAIGLRLDALSATVIATVAVVGFLIHLYSAELMAADEGFARFFAVMNLFVASMLTLVLADNLLLLYLGWEGVGLCSYLLIGFWYRDPANGRAARKAFVVTRVGDTAMMIGLLLIYTRMATLDIARLLQRMPAEWTVGSAPAVAAALLLLGGAVGKSAQLPLQTWLPDAMAGPTPTSALIHAATMVTAGVYLIARMHTVFELAPAVQIAVAIVGSATLLLAATSALFQSDIKRILAYSTMSQIGYMFVALGVGAWSAAIFHLVTHAFFKALLFLGAGVVIETMQDEHDISKMGGLYRRAPLGFAAFVVGGAALAGLPLITAGYYSKELILWQAWSGGVSPLFWVAGMAGVLLTTLYTMRLILYVFAGSPPAGVEEHAHWPIRSAIYALCALALVGGFLNFQWPPGRLPALTGFLGTVLPTARILRGGLGERTSAALSTCMILAGVLLAHHLFLRKRTVTEDRARTRSGAGLRDFWKNGWGFDFLYAQLFVRPLWWLARLGKADLFDGPYRALAGGTRAFHRILSGTQTGRLRAYVAGIAFGAVALLTWVLLR